MVNWNAILAYETYKTCSIRDWRLGALHYLFEAVIFAYIIWQIVVKTLYIAKSPVAAGSVGTSLRLNTTSLPPAPPSYCTPSGNIAGCLFWTPDDAVYPASSSSSLFVTTRVSISYYPPVPANCSTAANPYLSLSPDYACTPLAGPPINKTSYYIANIEAMTLRLDHTARSSISSPTILSVNQMVGKLYDSHGDVVASYDDRTSQLAQNISGDIIPLGQLISVAGGNLEGPSGAPGAPDGEIQRNSGMILSLLISYENRQSSISNIQNVALKYKYYPARVPASEYKITESVVTANGGTIVLDRHGVYIAFAQTGQIGEFSFIALLNSLVSSIALLK
ncbi:cytochrome c oxidase subunit 1, partial [Irineochytrium annulatum]